jgi:23S rRNA pseudouridine1911/1915/1917 synthase
MNVIYQDKDVLVIDKPAGLSVFKEGEEKEMTVIDLALQDFPELKNTGEYPRYGMAHRLDKQTSGVLLIAKNDDTLRDIQYQFKNGLVLKEYIALCSGKISDDYKLIETLVTRSPKDRRKQKAYPLYDVTVRGTPRKAKTEYQVLKKNENYTLIKAILHTGRKHQIRCHMTYIGHPIVGDPLYGFKNDCKLKRQFLHAKKIEIEINERKLSLSSELPEDLSSFLNFAFK